jgi:hypothetical protein
MAMNWPMTKPEAEEQLAPIHFGFGGFGLGGRLRGGKGGVGHDASAV